MATMMLAPFGAGFPKKQHEGEGDERDQESVREMLTAEQVLAMIPISRTTLFRLERDKLFPKGQAITPHRTLWFLDEVAAWQRDLQDPNSALAQAMQARNAKALARAMEARRLKKAKVRLKAI